MIQNMTEYVTPNISSVLKKYQTSATKSLQGPGHALAVAAAAAVAAAGIGGGCPSLEVASTNGGAGGGVGIRSESPTCGGKVQQPPSPGIPLIKKEILSSPEPHELQHHHRDAASPQIYATPATPPRELSQPILSVADAGCGELYETRLEGKTIGCFSVGGEMRLCLPQFLNNVLNDFSLEQINRIFDELGIYCSQCTPDQLVEFKAAKILPSDVKASGLITRTDAERLCAALLHRSDRNSYIPIESLAKGALSFHVYHKCFGKCEGICTPEMYSYQKPTCIKCLECDGWFSPQKFVGHVHRKFENQTCHWGFDSRNWHDYLHVALDVENREKYQIILDQLKEVELKEMHKAQLEMDHKKRKAEMLMDDASLLVPLGLGAPHGLVGAPVVVPLVAAHAHQVSLKAHPQLDIPGKKMLKGAAGAGGAPALDAYHYQIMYAHCVQQQQQREREQHQQQQQQQQQAAGAAGVHLQNGKPHLGSEFELSTDTDDDSLNGEPDSSAMLPPWEQAVECLRETRPRDRERVLQLLQRLLQENQQFRYNSMQQSDLLHKQDAHIADLTEQLQRYRRQFEDLDCKVELRRVVPFKQQTQLREEQLDAGEDEDLEEEQEQEQEQEEEDRANNNNQQEQQQQLMKPLANGLRRSPPPLNCCGAEPEEEAEAETEEPATKRAKLQPEQVAEEKANGEIKINGSAKSPAPSQESASSDEEEDMEEEEQEEEEEEEEEQVQAPHSSALATPPTATTPISPDSAATAGQLFDSSNSSDESSMKKAQMSACHALAKMNNNHKDERPQDEEDSSDDEMPLQQRQRQQQQQQQRQRQRCFSKGSGSASASASDEDEAAAPQANIPLPATAPATAPAPAQPHPPPMATKASKKQTPPSLGALPIITATTTSCEIQIKTEIA
ncbi:ski-like protein isoform X2 [Drosophila guanche]|uniref:ski-like protein isoform X2 n=1 Tax=Drosophila guanche TaxID=7266 RepID=UPI001471938B|nr:ski-like protein isoform X2 [Drosophila guanche]